MLRLIEELLAAARAVQSCGNGGARLSREASDKTRKAISSAVNLNL